MKHLLSAALLMGAIPLACTKENAPPAPTAAAVAPGDPTVVARINGQPITAKELDDSLDEDTRKQLFKMKEGALEALIIKRIASAEAKKVGKNEDDWIKDQIETKNPPATEAEAKAYFDSHPDQMPPGMGFDQLKEKLIPFITNQKRRDAALKLFEDLKQANKVEVLLEEPETPVKVVEAKGPSKGPATAPITIVEFSDFQCPFCSRVEPTVNRVLADYAGKVRFVFRDYPLPFHEFAQKAAEASHCAEDQGKYWEFHDAMFAHQDQLAVDALKKLAKDSGLDDKKFGECLDTSSKKELVASNAAAGSAVGVNGTPAFFVNGHSLSGAIPYEEFKKAIDKELKKAAPK